MDVESVAYLDSAQSTSDARCRNENKRRCRWMRIAHRWLIVWKEGRGWAGGERRVDRPAIESMRSRAILRSGCSSIRAAVMRVCPGKDCSWDVGSMDGWIHLRAAGAGAGPPDLKLGPWRKRRASMVRGSRNRSWDRVWMGWRGAEGTTRMRCKAIRCDVGVGWKGRKDLKRRQACRQSPHTILSACAGVTSIVYGLSVCLSVCLYRYLRK